MTVLSLNKWLRIIANVGVIAVAANDPPHRIRSIYGAVPNTLRSGGRDQGLLGQRCDHIFRFAVCHFGGVAMHWLDEDPQPINIWFMTLVCILASAGIAALVWVATGPAKGAEPPAWLAPTLVMPDGLHVTGEHGWHPREYPSMPACEKQRALARFMTPPQGAQEVLWECLTYNPMEGQGA